MSRALLATLLLSWIAGSALPASAQPPEAPVQTGSTYEADEDFELNIDEKRITEEGFHASTAVELRSEQAQGLELRVGTEVGARRIDVLLRGVRGRVRFLASLGPVLHRIESHRAPPPGL